MRTWLSRNLVLLGFSQAFGMAGVSAVVLLGGILGDQLAPIPVLATLPNSLMVVGTAVAVVPAALMMRRTGRRKGFLIGSVTAGFAMLLAAASVSMRSFPLFCLATLLVGVNSAFVQQYRFAAVESVTPRFSSRAVSFVLVGGIVAGFIGPEIAKRTRDLLPIAEFSGSFISLALLYGIVLGLLAFMEDSKIAQVIKQDEGERSLFELARQPMYLTAVACSAVSYGVMSFIMTATPVYMHQMQGFDLDQTTWVIQSHIIAMFLPSLISGWIIEKIGWIRVIFIGLVCYLGCVTIGVISRELLDFWSALVLLGLGWNFLYVGGTVLLTKTYRPQERFKSQAANDFLVLGIQAFTSLSAGGVLFASNWGVLNLINLPFLAITAGLILFQRQAIKSAVAVS